MAKIRCVNADVWGHPDNYPVPIPPNPSCLLKCHGHGHDWSSYIPFIPYQSALPFERLCYFKFWPWKSKAMVKEYGYPHGQSARSHSQPDIKQICFLCSSHKSDQQLLTYSYFKIPPKIQGNGYEWGQRPMSYNWQSIQPMHFLFISH